MAIWGLKYQCCFKAKDGKDYAVSIYKKDWRMPRIAYWLTAAANPFVTQEADSDDPFTPVRGQTGYLRILYEKPSNAPSDMTIEKVIEDLIPENNTDILVRLLSGTYTPGSSDYWFVPDEVNPIKWQGFIKSQVFSQRWSGSVKEVEIPVASVLETLKNVSIPSMPAISMPLRQLIREAAEAIKPSDRSIIGPSIESGQLVWTDVFYMHELAGVGTNIWSSAYISRSAFLKAKEYTTEGNVKNRYVEGMSFYNVFAAIGKLFGFCFREEGQYLHVRQMCYFPTSSPVARMPWQFIINGDEALIRYGGYGSQDMEDLDYRTSDNQRSITMGRKNAWATLQLNANFQLGLELPDAPENEDEQFSVLGGPTPVSDLMRLRVQPHKGNNDNATEYMYQWYLCIRHGEAGNKWNPTVNQLGETSTPTHIGDMNNHIYLLSTGAYYDAQINDATIYDNVDMIWDGRKWVDYYQYPYEYWQQIFLSTPLNNVSEEDPDGINPLGEDLFPMWVNSPRYWRVPLRQYMTLGAIPVRYALDKMGEDTMLQQGHLLTMLPDMWHDSGESYVPDYYKLLTLKSEQTFRFSDGYIVINFNALLINSHHATNDASEPKPYTNWTEFLNSRVDNATAKFAVQLKWGNKYWAGTAWSTTESTFVIETDPHAIKSNYDSTMNCEDIGGFYIPVPQNESGTPEFSIYSYFYYGSEDVHSLILTDMNVTYIPTRSTVISTSGTNRYMRTILTQGFSDDVEVDLGIGTWNNNIPSVNLLVDSNSDYIQQLTYKPASGSGESYVPAITHRPEIRLLEYLRLYYMQKRHIYKATVHRDIEGGAVDFYQDIFEYEGRRFSSVLSSRDWKKDTIRAKFIESFVKSEE